MMPTDVNQQHTHKVPCQSPLNNMVYFLCEYVHVVVAQSYLRAIMRWWWGSPLCSLALNWLPHSISWSKSFELARGPWGADSGEKIRFAVWSVSFPPQSPRGSHTRVCWESGDGGGRGRKGETPRGPTPPKSHTQTHREEGNAGLHFCADFSFFFLSRWEADSTFFSSFALPLNFFRLKSSLLGVSPSQIGFSPVKPCSFMVSHTMSWLVWLVLFCLRENLLSLSLFFSVPFTRHNEPNG